MIGEREECHKTSEEQVLQAEVGTGCFYVTYGAYYVFPAERGVTSICVAVDNRTLQFSYVPDFGACLVGPARLIFGVG